MLEALKESFGGLASLVGWILVAGFFVGAAVAMCCLVIFMRSFPQGRKR